MRRVHQRVGLQGFQACFPQPTTASSIKRLTMFWNTLEEELGFKPPERKMVQTTLEGEIAEIVEYPPKKKTRRPQKPKSVRTGPMDSFLVQKIQDNN